MNFQSQLNLWKELYFRADSMDALEEIHYEVKRLLDKYYTIIKYSNCLEYNIIQYRFTQMNNSIKKY